MTEWLLTEAGWRLYVLLFVLLLAGAFGLPIPEDAPLVLGGIVVHRGTARFLPVAAVSYAAIVTGDVFIYTVGRRFGPSLLKSRFVSRRLDPDRVAKMNDSLHRHAFWMIFVARHLFYLRTITFLTCGMFGMSFSKFLVADAVAAAVSAPLMIAVGYYASEGVGSIGVDLGLVEKSATAVLVVAVLTAVTAALVRRGARG